MNTTVQPEEALLLDLIQAWPELAGAEGRRRGLAREAARELRRWGHEGHDIQLERVSRMPGEPRTLRCLFWCEICHVSQLLVLRETRVQ